MPRMRWRHNFIRSYLERDIPQFGRALPLTPCAATGPCWPTTVWTIEIKRSMSPKVDRGFHAACVELSPDRKLVVYPGSESFPLGNDVLTVPLGALCSQLRLSGTI